MYSVARGCFSRLRGRRALGVALALLIPPASPSQPLPGDVAAEFAPQLSEAHIVYAAVVRPDGGIYVGGRFSTINGTPRNNLALLRPDGSVDPSFNPGTGTDQAVFSLALQGEKLLVGGAFTNYNGLLARRLMRLLPDGTTDPSFAARTLINASGAYVSTLLVQPDGSFYAGGFFPAEADIGRRNLARLLPDGAVDDGFNAIATVDVPVACLARLPDGRLVFGGSRLGRLLANGLPDTTFAGGAGSTLAYNAVTHLALQPNGSVICVGSFTRAGGAPADRVVRLLADGTRDASFNLDGDTDGRVASVHPLPDGTCLVGGEFSVVGGLERRSLARLLSNGRVDPVFRCDLGVANLTSTYYATILTFAPTASGRVLAAGSLASANGLPRSGLVLLEPGQTGARPAAVNAPGGLLQVPASDDLRLTVRVDGSPVPTVRWFREQTEIAAANFDTLVISNITAAAAGSYRVVAQNASGTVTQLVARIEVTSPPALPGEVVPEFYPGSGPGPRARLSTDRYVYSAVPRPSGGVVVGGVFSNFNGRSSISVAGLRADGTFEPGFNIGTGPSGPTPSVSPDVRLIERLPSGHFLVAGNHSSFNGVAAPALTRLHPDGAVDPAFRLTGFATLGAVTRMLRQPDGRWLIAGQFSATNPISINGLARIEADGTLDPSFRPLTGVANPGSAPGVLSMALLPDNRVVIGGFFQQVQNQRRNAVAMLRPDGLLDPDFAPTNSIVAVRAVGVQSGGRVLIGGDFESSPTIPRPFLARLHPDGSGDASFDATATIRTRVNQIHVLADQRILVATGGLFAQGVPNSGVFRLLPDGSPDPSFGDRGRTDNGVLGLHLDPAGALWIAGGFSKVNGVARAGVARLQHEPQTDGPPPLLHLRLAGNTAEVSFDSFTGRTYQLEHRDALGTGGWTAGQAAPGNGGTLVLRDQPLTPGNRFYRVRVAD